ncbi:hypothetical protein [Streptomyces tremellae]|uniref:DNA-binding protein n=1 Tax=Streptomyces tremellae TaxID=1124239 RepID=A0ABP7ESV2_9ACTN
MKWTITVEASGDDATETPATITAIMQSDPDGAPRIVELTVRAAHGGGVPSRAARDIDFEMLARAISGATAPVPPHPQTDSGDGGRAPSPPRAETRTERPYRKMPDEAEVREVFLRTGSVGKVARHYDVPRYTAQAWVDRLRRMGHLEDRKPLSSR